MRTLSIRTKLILLITVIATVILAGILAAITQSLYHEMEREVVADFDETQHYFKRQESLIYDRLVESCLLIGQNAAFKANVALNDPPSVQQSVEEFAMFTKTDLLVVTDPAGRVLAWLDRPGAVGRDLSERPGMAAALAGEEPDWLLEQAVLWDVDNQLLQVVTVPIRAGGALLGAITMGTRFTDFEASFLKGRSDIEISMFLDGKLVGSSLSDSTMPDRLTHLERFHEDVLPVIEPSVASGRTGEVFPARFAGREVFAFVSPLGQGARGYYLAIAEKSKQLVLLYKLSRRIFFIGLLGFALAVLLALVMGNRFTRPVLALAGAMDSVTGGDLNVSLPVRSHDEVGKLTATFNNMIKALRERLYLMRYVGGHTINMIRSEETDWLSSRGKRMEVAVLFSDIRGFTAYTENKQPEEVIEMLNIWLGFQAEAVRRLGGFVDKYAGDEMFALFTGDDALGRAYRCACDIQDQARSLARQYDGEIAVGIGLNHGPVVMGNIGNESRMDYTVIGASVNLGARLCGAAQGGEILFTADIAGRLRLDAGGSRQEEMTFKGISQPVRVIRWTEGERGKAENGKPKVETGKRKLG